ncbi:MAG: fasciclin domain-containing protein [Halieaceae bacterium]|nr:fasciclin domain-containing protein [Halieaceae bacterium]
MNLKKLVAAVAVTTMLPAAITAVAGHHGDHEKAAEYSMTKPTIVEIAAGNDDFSTLVAAVQAADLAEVLQGDGPYTVFAPTNEAFAALPEGTVEMLLKPENKQKLVDVLTYHVVAGEVYAKDVVTLDSATTVQGGDVKISTHDGMVMIDNAHVVSTDIAASNGVIHVIDAVILPQS